MTNNASGNGAAAQQQILCAALLFMPIAYMVAPIAMHFAGVLPEGGFGNFDDQIALILGGAFLMAGISSAAFSKVLKKKLLEAPDTDGSSNGPIRFRAVLVAMALSESGAGSHAADRKYYFRGLTLWNFLRHHLFSLPQPSLAGTRG